MGKISLFCLGLLFIGFVQAAENRLGAKPKLYPIYESESDGHDVGMEFDPLAYQRAYIQLLTRSVLSMPPARVPVSAVNHRRFGRNDRALQIVPFASPDYPVAPPVEPHEVYLIKCIKSGRKIIDMMYEYRKYQRLEQQTDQVTTFGVFSRSYQELLKKPFYKGIPIS